MKQKFKKLEFVHICKNMPKNMSHFESGFKGIVDGTYSQMYGGKDIDSYSVYRLENDKIVDHISWYKENQLSLAANQDRWLAEQLIEDYNFSEEED